MFFIRQKSDGLLRKVEFNDFVRANRATATAYHSEGNAAFDLLAVTRKSKVISSNDYEIVEEINTPSYRVVL
jgi:hypothetical protein